MTLPKFFSLCSNQNYVLWIWKLYTVYKYRFELLSHDMCFIKWYEQNNKQDMPPVLFTLVEACCSVSMVFKFFTIFKNFTFSFITMSETYMVQFYYYFLISLEFPYDLAIWSARKSSMHWWEECEFSRYRMKSFGDSD